MNEARSDGLRIEAPETARALLEDVDLRRVFAALEIAGEETRVVGGALRNALLQRSVQEIDLATTLLPEAVAARAAAAGLRAIPTGIEHGTITVLSGKKTFEVTTLREDIETDGRRAKVRFGRDFRADALRRDFTINALSMTRGGWLYDYTGGLDDIASRKVRFIGEPHRRIAEDYLRILRFFRFSAEFGEGPLDVEGRATALHLRDGLARLSRERVRAELLKLLCARRAAEICSEMSGDGLLHVLVASVPDAARLRRVIEIASCSPADPVLRLAALCVRLPEDVSRLREQLRLSNGETERLETAARALVSLHGRGGPPIGAGLQALLFRFGRQASSDALVLAQADDYPERAALWDEARKSLAATADPRLPFSGADLIARGIGEGGAIGEALKELEAAWIKAGFPTDRACLDRLIEEAVRNRQVRLEGGARRMG
jgi:poly(A) polymerase